MTCPRCRAEHAPSSKFCPHCGQRLARLCPRCGAPSLGEPRFCGDCGDRRARRRHPKAARSLGAESRRQPLCLVVEDLHWIDTETQAVLDALVESIPTAAILLVVTYRPEYAHDWGRKSYHAQLSVPSRRGTARGSSCARCSVRIRIWPRWRRG